MDVLRTDDAAFEGLPEYPFAPAYLDAEPGLRMHYVDVGPRDADPVLMLHGEPSWSFLYRRMVRVCTDAGHRVVAPDLVGFGRSDKPARVEEYTYARHVAWTARVLEHLDLRRVTLVCQDWGSLIGLRLAAEHADRFARIVVANGMLPTGAERVPPAFVAWKTFALKSPWFPIGRIVATGTARELSRAELAAYDAPFPDARYKAGARAFPALVPVRPDDPASEANRAAWDVLSRWEKPFLTCFSTGDPITRGGDRYLQKRIPGAAGMPHVRLPGGHFLQEDVPVELATKVNELIAATP